VEMYWYQWEYIDWTWYNSLGRKTFIHARVRCSRLGGTPYIIRVSRTDDEKKLQKGSCTLDLCLSVTFRSVTDQDRETCSMNKSAFFPTILYNR
jgi:hypothetical protein